MLQGVKDAIGMVGPEKKRKQAGCQVQVNQQNSLIGVLGDMAGDGAGEGRSSAAALGRGESQDLPAAGSFVGRFGDPAAEHALDRLADVVDREGAGKEFPGAGAQAAQDQLRVVAAADRRRGDARPVVDGQAS